MAINDFTAVHAYGYLDKCETLQSGPKANKEIGLFKAMMTFVIWRNVINVNPLEKLEKLPVHASNRYVEDHEFEFEFAREAGRVLGEPQYIVALPYQTAYLCVRRSAAVCDLTLADVRDTGIL